MKTVLVVEIRASKYDRIDPLHRPDWGKSRVPVPLTRKRDSQKEWCLVCVSCLCLLRRELCNFQRNFQFIWSKWGKCQVYYVFVSYRTISYSSTDSYKLWNSSSYVLFELMFARVFECYLLSRIVCQVVVN